MAPLTDNRTLVKVLGWKDRMRLNLPHKKPNSSRISATLVKLANDLCRDMLAVPSSTSCAA